jgi:glyoxylate/hydroxypyruvate reductase A
MQLAIVAPHEDGAAWSAALRRELPELGVRIWPELGDPAAIDAAFVWRHPHGALAGLPNLRAIFSLGAGVDGILADPLLPRAVPLVRMLDPNLATLMAEYVLAAALRHHCDLDRYQRLQREARWERRTRPALAQRRAGVMGLGALGSAAARALACAGFDCAGWARTPKSIAGVRSYAGEAGLEAFVARSEILVCLLPLTPRTHGILDARLFARMPRGGYLINAARGAHLIASDLIAALDAGQLAGATLDVFAVEPLPSGDPLWSHPLVLVTPHAASITPVETAARLVADNLRRLSRGEPLSGVVEAGRGY